jgi:uncharacterized protein (UPF0264 family)
MTAPDQLQPHLARALQRQPGAPTRLLVSVRDPQEALIARRAGVDFIDLKEPSQGALGGLTPADIRAVLAALQAEDAQPAGAASQPATPRPPLLTSATIGDWPMDGSATEAMLAAIAAVDATGVDLVKVGLLPAAPGAAPDPAIEAAVVRLITRHLAATPTCRAGRLVPVLIADRPPISQALVDALLRLPIPALLLDTADKTGGSLLDRHGPAALAAHLAQLRARRPDLLAGLAGSLRLAEVGQIRELAPDIAGFRGAACAGPRQGTLDAAATQALRARFPVAAAAGPARDAAKTLTGCTA